MRNYVDMAYEWIGKINPKTNKPYTDSEIASKLGLDRGCYKWMMYGAKLYRERMKRLGKKVEEDQDESVSK